MTIEKRPFGNTGHMSSSIIFGGAALWEVDQATADKVLDMLFQFGVNHIDTAPRYGDSEIRIGSWMTKHRKDFFLATKTADRSYKGALDSLKKSLDRLQTDHVDLIQLHSLTHPDEWDQVFSSGGALEALVEAKEAGLARFIGVTGHGWTAAAMHLRSLKKYPFDSVLLPWNWFAAHHRNYPKEFFATLDFCESKSVAVQTIKGVARGPWGAGIEPTHSTWYQPLEDENCIKNAVHYVLSQPGLFFNSAGDINILPLVLRAAQSPIQCPSTSEMDDMAKQVGLSSIFGL